jgi:hypothetical protein
MNKYFSVLVLLSSIFAADLEWQADFRYRLETDKDIENTDSIYTRGRNTFHYTRSRISLRLVEGPITGFAQLQDSRLLGGEDNFAGLSKASGVKIEFHQIYFQVNNLLKRNWSMKFGRFEMPLGAQRLFSKNNWNNYGRSFEGVHSFTKNRFGSINLFYLINEENSGTADSDYYDERINGIYLSPLMNHLPFIDMNVFDLYWYNYIKDETFLTDQSVKIERSTMGSRWAFNFLFTKFEGEFAIQSGKFNQSSSISEIDANFNVFNFHLDLSRLPVISKISFGKEYFSGDDTLTANLEGFANPWGAGHKYHGYTDQFTRFNDNDRSGLDEWNVKAEFLLPGNFMLNVHYHDFKDVIKSDPLGTELDVVISKKMGFGGVLQQGFAVYWPEEGEKIQYSFFMLNITL